MELNWEQSSLGLWLACLLEAKFRDPGLRIYFSAVLGFVNLTGACVYVHVSVCVCVICMYMSVCMQCVSLCVMCV